MDLNGFFSCEPRDSKYRCTQLRQAACPNCTTGLSLPYTRVGTSSSDHHHALLVCRSHFHSPHLARRALASCTAVGRGGSSRLVPLWIVHRHPSADRQHGEHGSSSVFGDRASRTAGGKRRTLHSGPLGMAPLSRQPQALIGILIAVALSIWRGVRAEHRYGAGGHSRSSYPGGDRAGYSGVLFTAPLRRGSIFVVYRHSHAPSSPSFALILPPRRGLCRDRACVFRGYHHSTG